MQILTIGTYIHIFMNNTENKIVTCQLQVAILNFPKFCKIYARKKSKNLILNLILNSKIVFKEFLWLKLLTLKNMRNMHLNV